MLGADYVSFHIGDYARQFRSSCLRVLGIDSHRRRWRSNCGGSGSASTRSVSTSGFHEGSPTGDCATPRAPRGAVRGPRTRPGRRAARLHEGHPRSCSPSSASSSATRRWPARRRCSRSSCRPRLESPSTQQRTRSSSDRPHQRALRPAGRDPVEYLHRNISKPGLVALYRRADVMMVTPLRDGMNLVAHEFVLCQSAPGSRQVARVAAALRVCGLGSGPARRAAREPLERGRRWSTWDGARARRPRAPRRLETMAKRVEALDCRRWADNFLARLARQSRRDRRRKPPPVDDEVAKERSGAGSRGPGTDDHARLRRDPARLEPHPDLAVHDAGDPRATTGLAALPGTDVHNVSGSAPAEPSSSGSASSSISVPSTGTSRARPTGSGKRSSSSTSTGCPIERLLRRAAADVPGAYVERKSCSSLALSGGRARVRLVARARAPERAPATAPGCSGGDPPRSPCRRGARAGVNMGVYVRKRSFRTGRTRRARSSSASATTGPTSSRRSPRARSPATSAACSRAHSTAPCHASTFTSVGPGEVRAFLRDLREWRPPRRAGLARVQAQGDYGRLERRGVSRAFASCSSSSSSAPIRSRRSNSSRDGCASSRGRPSRS